MRLRRPWRARWKIARFLLSLPLAFGLLMALNATGMSGSCGSDGDWSACGVNNPAPFQPVGGGPPATCTPSWSAHTAGYDAWTIVDADAQYEDAITARGYRTDACDGSSYGLDQVTLHTRGEEICPPTATQTDWDETEDSPTPMSWVTLDGYGHWATKAILGPPCPAGHWVDATVEATATDSETGLQNRQIYDNYHCYLIYPTPDGYVPPGC